MVISNVHGSLNAGHRENYIQSVTDRTRKRDILAKRKDVSRRFSHWLPSKSTLPKANIVKLTKKSAYDKIKKMDEDRLAILKGGGYVQGWTSGKLLTKHP